MGGEIEAELKFALTGAEHAALKAADDLAGMTVNGPRTETLVSTYFDSADERLRQAGISLRVRRKGKTIEQTVKVAADGARAPGAHLGALASRHEITVAAEREVPDLTRFPDGAVAETIGRLLGGEELRALFTIRVKRTVRHLATQAGDEIEYALDDGEIVAGDRRAELREAEFELKRGDPRALFGVAAIALRGVPVRFSAAPKSEAGYRLAEGRTDEPPTPAKAAEAEIPEDATVETALQAVLRSCFVQIAANLPVVLESDDPEGPHQLRVGLRRLRSALSLFSKVIERGAADRLVQETRWLAGIVGELRDIDVLIHDVVAPCGERIDVTGLLAVLEARRGRVRGRLLAALAGPRTGAFLIGLAGFVEGRGWLSHTDLDQTAALAAPAHAFAEKAVHRQWRKVARMGRDAARLSGEERHELRKRFKKLRYALDFFGGQLSGRDRRKLTRDVKAAQEVLGYLNDVRMAEQLISDLPSDPDYAAAADRGALDRAAGYCLGWHQARADAVFEQSLALVALDEAAF
jgi:triphosphatase